MTRTNAFAALLSGFLLALAFPGGGMPACAWFALVPLLAAVRGRTAGQALRLGVLAGLMHFGCLLYWLVPTLKVYGGLPWIAGVAALGGLTGYLSLYMGLFAALVVGVSGGVNRLAGAAPLLWVGMEYLRTVSPLGFPWELLGYSQVPWLTVVQIADLAGVYGVSALIVVVNVALTAALLALRGWSWQGRRVARSQALALAAVALVLLGAAWGYGRMRLNGPDTLPAVTSRSTVGLIQGNIAQDVKWSPAFQKAITRKYLDLSRQAVAAGARLVVWPETATPFYLEPPGPLAQELLAAVARSEAAFVVGSPAAVVARDRGQVTYRNSAYLITPARDPHQRYDKAHLVPFGEYVPFQRWLFFLDKLVEPVGDFRPGRPGQVLIWQERRLGVLICFEAIFAHLARAQVRNGADVLLNITNDAWYGRTSAPHQHFGMAVMRAVETRRSLVRVANTGISGVIGPDGRVAVRSGLFEDRVLVQPVAHHDGRTLYVRLGDLPARLCLAFSAVLALNACRRAYRRRRRCGNGS